MAFVIADRVKETTTTTGTGTVTLLGAATGFQSFSAIGNANTTYYAIVNQTGTEWEVGLGTYTASGTTLARTTVIASSNAGSAVNFSAGTKDVFVTYPSGRAVLANSSLTSGRVPYATTSGFLTDSANLLYSGTDLTVYGLTVGRGAGAGATNTAVGINALAAHTTSLNDNTAFGYNALAANSTARGLTAIGSGALGSATSNYSTALGYNAGTANTTGNIVALGRDALLVNTTGTFNSALGYKTLQANTTGSNNTGLGYQALASNTTGGNNTAVGHTALTSNTTANNNTAVGYQAGNSNTTGTNNAFVGYQSGYGVTTGSRNVALGNTNLLATTTANENTAIGNQVLVANTSGESNSGLGHAALYQNTTGSNNTGLGSNALFANTTGGNNTAVGNNAGNGITTGSNNTYLGFSATQSGVAVTGEIVICTASTTGKGSNTGYINTSGGVYQGNNSAAWSITSDQRIKKNIVDVTGALDKVLALRPVEFDYKENDKHEVGFIAQEYQQVLPDQVTTHAANEAEKQWVDEDGMVMGVTQNLVPYLVKAIQELKAEFDAYKSTHP
jgi:hypothetical protein